MNPKVAVLMMILAGSLLAQRVDPRTMAELRETLLNTNLSEESRVYAAQRLGALGALDLLCEGLLINQESRQVQISILRALGSIRAPEAVPALLKFSEGDLHPEVYRAVMEALYNIMDLRAVPFFINSLKVPDPELRRQAAEALGDLLTREESERAIQALKEVYLTTVEPEVRVALVTALGKMGGRMVIEPLTLALRDENEVVRRIAVEFLGELGDPGPIPEIARLLEDRSSPECQKAAAEALVRIGEPTIYPPLISALDNKWEIRSFIYTLLANTRSREAIPHFVDSLASEREVLVTDLERLLPDQHHRFGILVIQSLDEALKRFEDPQVQKRIVQLLGALNYRVESHSKAAVSALGEVLQSIERYRDPEVRSAAADALGKISDLYALTYLKESLRRDPDPVVRRRSIQALRKIGQNHPQGAIEVIFLLDVYGLGDRDELVMIEAIKALSALGDGLSLPRLRSIEASEAYSISVRQAAREAANQIEVRMRRG